MSTTITITGTGCPIPSATRAGPGVLIEYDGVRLQFDAGRSTVQRLAACDLWPSDLDAVFLTHHHSDHVVGLQDLVLTRWVMDRGRRLSPLPVVSPVGPASLFVERMLEVWHDDIVVRMGHSGVESGPEVDSIAFEVPSEPSLVWSRGELRVLAGPVHHEPVHPAVGYRVETPDGVVAISGDTIVCDEVAALAEGADMLIYEAMRFEVIEQREEHLRFILDYHADTRLIGAQARELGVRTLVLTHLIPAPDTAIEAAAFVDDIRAAGFEGELIVAEDLDSISLG